MIRMKIIIRDENELKRCFIQLKDVDYLVERFNSPKLGRLILGNNKFRHLGKYDFFEIKNRGVAQMIEENPYIVDFSEMVKYDGLTLSRLILLAQNPLSTNKKKLDEEHRVDDLQDIMSFNRGMLTYPIPILYDERIIYDNDEVVFGSTTLPNYYMLRPIQEDIDLNEYLAFHHQSLFESVLPEDEMASYQVTEIDGGLLVHFDVKNKVLSKIRKRITG